MSGHSSEPARWQKNAGPPAPAGPRSALGFDQVVQLCHGRITRDQVRTASATLCRDGHLDRIRTAVYQWSGGRRATIVPPATAAPPAPLVPARSIAPRSRPAVADAPTAAELFEQLFPDGVQMTAELLHDFEQWAELTAKLTAHTARRSRAS